MSDNNKNKDIFLQSIGEVKPLKKSEKSYKKLKIIEIKKVKKLNTVSTPSNIRRIIDKKSKNKKIFFRIESAPLEKKIKKGKVLINKKIDFHGLSIEEAKSKFLKTIDECFYTDNRCILFVTGKGTRKTNQDVTKKKLFYGMIRENFKQWIYERAVFSKILHVVPAGFSHGGDGAFFVYLRKNKN